LRYLQTPQEKSLLSVLPDIDAPMHTLRLLVDRIQGGESWYPTSAGISIGATATLEGTNSAYP